MKTCNQISAGVVFVSILSDSSECGKQFNLNSLTLCPLCNGIHKEESICDDIRGEWGADEYYRTINTINNRIISNRTFIAESSKKRNQKKDNTLPDSSKITKPFSLNYVQIDEGDKTNNEIPSNEANDYNDENEETLPLEDSLAFA
ncbi:hypothetical protein C1646_753706 [Rhizophagus diaphanus]|nr:hypothetical protein C1646_753706 [Rhizophagus diaphanus] [Rhizophagus sp. MUCL 43196]